MVKQPECDASSFGTFLRELTFDFFGSGQHSMTVNQLLSTVEGVLLDVRSTEEVRTIALTFSYDIMTLHIPTSDIPDRLSEIPKDRPVAIFCSAGTRSAIVYAYLRIMGFDRVRILVDRYPDLTEQAKPGILWKRLKAKENHS